MRVIKVSAKHYIPGKGDVVVTETPLRPYEIGEVVKVKDDLYQVIGIEAGPSFLVGLVVKHLKPDEVASALRRVDPILQFFGYAHLPVHLQGNSKPFHDLATWIVETLPRNAERTVALRKLLEAKDAGVRASIMKDVTP